jgi:alkylation response protein AidB-like acyl-CoA dehydrogenase
VNFAFPAEVEEFRLEVRRFLEEEITPEVRDEYRHGTDYPHGFNKAVSRKLGGQGWLSLTWPKIYGGEERSIWYQVALDEELAAAHCPIAAHQVSANFVGPALIFFASDEHKLKHLPPIARGEEVWALGWTEPNAGSDLAAVETRAVRDGDDWVIDGTKIFTEHIQDADYCWVLARTDPTAEKHRGCTAFIVPVRSPGLSMTPLWTMDGYRINQVTFDNVRVPAGAQLGELHRGFYHLAATSNQLRSSGLGRWTENHHDLLDLIEFARETKVDGLPLISESWVRGGIAGYAIHVQIERLLAYRVASMIDNGGPAPDKEAAIRRVWDKVFGPDHIRFGLEMMGLAGQLGRYSPDHAPIQARWQRRFMSEIGGDHNGGSAEIVMNTVISRVLNLPR